MNILGQLWSQSDRIKMEALNQNLKRNQVVSSNIANAETPGYRALGYDFEKQLQNVARVNDNLPMKASSDKHFISRGVNYEGGIDPEVYVVPTESVGEDGNTVDVDAEMAKLAQNQIAFRTMSELIGKKIGMLRYAISGGTR